MIEQCGELLAKKKLNLTFIESASAGYLAYRFSMTPFSGDILYGGLVCYDLKVKENILKINPDLVDKFTAESAQVTEELVRKSKKIFDSKIHIACTGLLKRGGSETPDKPVGTFFYAILYKNKVNNFKCVLKGKKS
jgi:nicotinamide-nucleotide amidase